MNELDPLYWVDELLKALPKAPKRTPEEVARMERFIAQACQALRSAPQQTEE